MDTAQILSAAYAEIFSCDVAKGGHYYGQRVNDSEIDYAHFDRESMSVDPDTDFFEAVVEDGSEGCWIRVELVRYIEERKRREEHHRDYDRFHVGLIKTLNEGRDAWRNMGALAGELAYVATQKVWPMCRAEREKAGDAQ